jgi:hypothetical protein
MRTMLIALTLLIAGCGRSPEMVEIDRDLARLVTSDTTALVDIKIDKLRGTPLYQKYIAGRIDAVKGRDDASEALFVFDGKQPRVFWKEKAGVFESVNGKGKVQPGRGSGGVPPALREKMRAIPSQSQIWGVGLGSSLMALDAVPQQGNLANLRNLFQALESWTMAADLAASAKIEANGVYRTGKDAQQIHDALRGLLGIARLSTPSDSPELLRLYDGVQISMEETSVRIKSEIAPADLDSLMRQFPANTSH